MENSLFFRHLTLISFIFTTNYTFCIPILPDFLYERGVSLTMIGVVFSAYQTAFFFTSVFLGKFLPFYSKQKILLFGQLLLTLSILGYPILSLPIPNSLFIFLVLFLRAIQGVGYSIMSLVVWFYFPVIFPEEVNETYATAEIWKSLGMSAGPILGGLFYEYLGYSMSFFTLASIYMISTLYFYPLIKQKQLALEHELSVTSPFLNRPLASLSILSHKEFLLSFFMFFFNIMCYGLIQPGFSQHIHSFIDKDYVVGLIFSLGDFTYSASGLFFIYFLAKKNIQRRKLLIFGGISSVLSILLIGPEKYTFLPQSLWVVTLGMILLGISQMLYIPIIIPEFLGILNEIEPNAKGKKELATGIFNAGIAVTQTTSTVLGGFLSEKFGFGRGLTIYALWLIGYIGIYAMLSGKKEMRKTLEI